LFGLQARREERRAVFVAVELEEEGFPEFDELLRVLATFLPSVKNRMGEI
jgi:stalled ribosome rescue protein Dom34